MKNIKGKYVKDYAAGGAVDAILNSGVGDSTAYNALRADLVALRTKFIALLGKLDADAGVTDTNYAATETPAALTSAVQTGKAVSTLFIPSPVKQGV